MTVKCYLLLSLCPNAQLVNWPCPYHWPPPSTKPIKHSSIFMPDSHPTCPAYQSLNKTISTIAQFARHSGQYLSQLLRDVRRQSIPKSGLIETQLSAQLQEINHGSEQLMGLFARKLQICPKFLGDGSGEMGRHCRWGSTHRNHILHKFANIFLLGRLEQHLQTLPIHTIIYHHMADPNSYPTRPPYYYPSPQENSHFIPSKSHIRISDPFTPTHSRISNIEIGSTQFVPKIIESGYIVGPPVAYTQAPNLPLNFQAFSPAQSIGNSSSKVVFSQPSHLYHPPPTEIKQVPVNQPSIVIHSPSKEETVSKSVYDRTVIQSRNWQIRYNELHMKYNGLLAGQGTSQLQQENRRLRLRVRQLQERERSELGKNKNIRELIERYKESTLKQCYLLLDRYRLECKQHQ